MLATFILPLGGIIFVDLVLSGDNALVIGAAIASIPPHWHRPVLFLGGAAAILLRIVFTIFTTFLLHIDYIQTIGGILVLWITWQLLVEPEQKEPSVEPAANNAEQQNRTGNQLFTYILQLFSGLGHFIINIRQPGQDRLPMAILTIVITDLSMSSDNIIVVAALAHGQLIALGIGLVISIIILLIGSALVARSLEHYPNLIILSGIMLAWIAGNLIMQDMSNLFFFFRQNEPYSSLPIYLLTFSFVGYTIYVHLKRRRRFPPSPPEDVDSSKLRRNKRPDPGADCRPSQKELQLVH